MIRITYQIVCDLCKMEFAKQEYDCINHPRAEFPRPTREFSYELQGALELCNDCAAPLIQAKQARIEEVLLQRHPFFVVSGELE